MSGIAAILNLSGSPADRATIDRMLAAVPYRARDGCGVWSEGPVAIGHAMLRTTPESVGEKQPLLDETGELCLALDGRVDNRTELAGKIESAGLRLRSDSDAELVLRAYQRWQDDAPLHIIGDFAFVIWDQRKRRLFCARDPLGIRTFFYYSDERGFICASELHQLFEDPRVAAKPNEAMIAETMVRQPHGRVETLYRGISRLPGAHSLSVRGGGLKVRRYYQLDSAPEIRYRSDDEYAQHFRELFREAVRCRLRGVGTVVADLSGGLDSSSIISTAVLMRSEGALPGLPIEAWSIISDQPESDERSFIEDVERKWQIEARRLRPTEPELPDYVAQVRHYKDLPDYANSAIGDYDSVLKGRDDIRVWLTGNGGDDFLSGSAYAYADSLRRLRFGSVIQLLCDEYRAVRNDPTMWSPLHSLFRQGLLPLVPGRVRRAVKSVIKKPQQQLPITEEFARRCGLAERFAERENLPGCADFAQQDVYRTFNAGWLAHPLEMCERWTAARGIEGRHPFYDRRLVEFAFGIPEQQRLRGDQTKFVMRNAMLGVLPESVRTRKTKANFSQVYVSTLQKFGGERLFDSLQIAALGWVDAGRVKSAYRRMLAMHACGDLNYSSLMRPLWMVFAMELWFSEVFGKTRMRAESTAIAPINSMALPLK